MKKAITFFAAALAAASVLTGCGKQPHQTPAAPSSISADTDDSWIVVDPGEIDDEMSKLLAEDHSPIYAYGKENIPELVAKALTALGSRDESTFDRCREGSDWGDTYKELREHIYKGIEKNGGDPTQTFTCKDLTVYEHQEYGFMELPWYEVYLKGYENDIILRIIPKTNDVDKQEYYLRVEREDTTAPSIVTYEHKPTYEVAQEKVEQGIYTLIDLSQYENKEDNSNG
ncbi:MAG: hypothetical protein K2J80_12495 [Oscillospiraceae bacterium]|nr:hypothetical protein [Oscillospiraceae bacterium]